MIQVSFPSSKLYGIRFFLEVTYCIIIYQSKFPGISINLPVICKCRPKIRIFNCLTVKNTIA